jgi:hypothetical protein
MTDPLLISAEEFIARLDYGQFYLQTYFDPEDDPDDAAEWPEAFEAHLDVDHHGLSYDSPTMGTFSLGVPPGAYHALIAGQGFIAHGWPGSTTPGDRWRIRLWPSSGPEVPRRLRAWPAPGH